MEIDASIRKWSLVISWLLRTLKSVTLSINEEETKNVKNFKIVPFKVKFSLIHSSSQLKCSEESLFLVESFSLNLLLLTRKIVVIIFCIQFLFFYILEPVLKFLECKIFVHHEDDLLKQAFYGFEILIDLFLFMD
ncbi:hypothetical protein BpHYR1_023979 [Brachionus plicatilis]|uniref:Uncharacterized protein n=1 Tax=Brachionus plicatilis TaxID=10195 RepID=A0A3M7SH36_BRAPC|nr:hypothetical protein BpHYR1_023979 [Brachionus plicatilis]